LISIFLAFFYIIAASIQVSYSISLERIHALEQISHGDIQKRFKSWRKLIETLKNKSVDVQLDQVNTFFNQFSYQSDLETKGVKNYWKTPEEFIIDGGGDCKDYVIIKYFTLLSLGLPTEKLRLTYVTSLSLKQAHMVLSYYPSPDEEPLILDSLDNKILKASKRPDLKPVYSFNGAGLWLATQHHQSTLIGQPNNLSKWDELTKRMQLQGDKP
jgi:predicted transglutaminase-like cysteine proteinase